MLPEHYLKELKKIVVDKLHVELTDKEAYELATFLVTYFNILLEAKHE